LRFDERSFLRANPDTCARLSSHLRGATLDCAVLHLSRLSLRGWLIAGVGAALAAPAGLWLADRAGAVHTGDARVQADMIAISADVAGRIVELSVAPGDRVEAGDVLVRLDDRETRLAVAALKLERKAVEAEIAGETLRATLAREQGASRLAAREALLASAKADVGAARALLKTAEAEHGRVTVLKTKGLTTQSTFDQSTARLETTRQALARGLAAIAETEAGVGEAAAQAREAEVIQQAIAVLAIRYDALCNEIALRQVQLDQHVVASPIAGIVAEVFADEGEHVSPGARIALAHDPTDVWIEANIKETDIRRVAAGAPVDIRLDAAAQACAGMVERIGSAAVSEFALIPNANPTGVFTKITQRIPVRVSIGADCPAARPGAMATLRIRGGTGADDAAR
jgi:membrane fusion protein, multidrug efflux system